MGPLATNASWSAGNMRDMGSMFTLYWTQAFFDGLQGHKETDIVMLPRAGWVGTWRHGAVLWSGDIGSTMEVLKSQVNIGISAQTSAIPWWTTDVRAATTLGLFPAFFWLSADLSANDLSLLPAGRRLLRRALPRPELPRDCCALVPVRLHRPRAPSARRP